MRKLISSVPVLWTLLILSSLFMGGFALWTPFVGGLGLDGLAQIDAVQALIESMTEAERNSHFWMTLLLDMFFPFAYGGLFLGLTLKYSGEYGFLLALPALAVIPIDIVENIVQLIALEGEFSVLAIKALLTPVKFFLFYLAAAIAVACPLIGTGLKLKQNRP